LGRAVAVKVQYPDVENLVVTDLAVLEQIVKVVDRLAPSIKLRPILDYLKETLPLELDFRREAESMMRLRAALGYRSDVIVPAFFPDLSTGRLLVMGCIEGIKITKREALERAGKLLNYVYGDQMLRLGILHADPHPGNLLVQPGPRIVLLDHGLTVSLAPSLVNALNRLVQLPFSTARWASSLMTANMRRLQHLANVCWPRQSAGLDRRARSRRWCSAAWAMPI